MADSFPALHLVIQMYEGALSRDNLRSELTSNEPAHSAIHAEIGSSSSMAADSWKVPSHLSSRVEVEERSQADPQTLLGAAVYILSLPSPLPTNPPQSSHTHMIIAELKAHLAILRAANSSLLILTVGLLPGSSNTDPRIAAGAYMRDLSLIQLTNSHGLEVAELIDMLHGIGDGMGYLALVNELRAWNGTTVALEVRYQSYANVPETQHMDSSYNL